MENENNKETIVIVCYDCGKPFNFEKGEQDFYTARNLNPPKRCAMDRLKRKAANEST